MTSAGVVLASFPSPPQGVWELGPFPLRAYALCIIAGIIVAIVWGNKRWVARGGEPETVTEVAVFAVPFGLVGGRLYHVITDHEKYFGAGRDPVDALKIWDGGLGIWGAVLLGGVGAWIACRRKGIPLPAFADAVAPGIVLAQAIGRLGNYFNQELYGRATTLPWGMDIYQRLNDAGLPDELNGSVPAGAVPVATVHPTFLYELLWNLAVAALVVWADRRFRLGHGRAFALYVAGYCAGRFWIELMRVDFANTLFGVRINVFTAVIVFLGAVTYFVLAKKGREDPSELTGRSAQPSPDETESEAGESEAGESGAEESGAEESGTAGSGTAESGTADSDGRPGKLGNH
ncbi:prolipoprotein diacylglyceryl transferase [Rhodococcus sp. X156]|uniref:prolipoprotein diacylglyceryl transferase n=1 Tax=Rhodococcus sp. X156 TaxID=2499145 RepID=UPI000FDAEA5D|nr:prolipoprotein diacylglyceryl transferase [Rhodococcus sp. X156]